MAKLGLKSNRVSAWTVAGIIFAATGIALVAGYAVHKLRMRSVMQNEIRDIMCVPGPEAFMKLGVFEIAFHPII